MFDIVFFISVSLIRCDKMVGSIFGNLLLFICLFSLFSLGMGKKEIIKTDAAPQSNLYSQAVRVGDLLFLSGSLGRDPKTGELKKGVVEQTWQSLENIGTILKAAGADFSDVVKCTVLLADIKDFAKMGEMYTQYFKVEPPARTCYQASALPAGADVEIECIAQVKKSKL